MKFYLQFTCEGDLIETITYKEATIIPNVGQICYVQEGNTEMTGEHPVVKEVKYLFSEEGQTIIIDMEPNNE